jgi:hypothetical protein
MRAGCRREKPTRFVRMHLETFPRPDAEQGPLIGPDYLAPGFRQWCPRYCPVWGCGGEPPSLDTVSSKVGLLAGLTIGCGTRR